MQSPNPDGSSEKPQRETYTVLVRGRQDSPSTARPYVGRSPRDAFDRALDDTTLTVDEPIMSWHSLDDVAAIDVDYHDGSVPEPAWLLDSAKRVEPRPNLYWVTHGGGLRLIYFADRGGSFTAHELALLAMIHIAPRFGGATGIEIKTDTRHPKYKRGRERAGDV